MIHQQSHRARRFVGRLEAGEDLVGTLSALCKNHDVLGGTVSIWGALDEVEMLHFDAVKKQVTPAYTPGLEADIVSLSGLVTHIGHEIILTLHGHLLTHGPAGPQSLVGQLKHARAMSCEFVLEVFEDLSLERGVDKATGRPLLRQVDTRVVDEAPAAAASQAPAAAAPAATSIAQVAAARQASMSWADAIEEAGHAPIKPKLSSNPVSRGRPEPSLFEESSEPEDDDADLYDDEDRPELKNGDLLDHPKLGRCRVLRMDTEDRVRIKIPKGGISTLALDYFDIFPAGSEGGRPLYRLEMRSKRKA